METKNIKITGDKEVYEAPFIEIIDVKVEKGVQMSDPADPGDGDGDDNHLY